MVHDRSMSRRSVPITAETILRAYRFGLFPMADTRTSDRVYWLDPDLRGIIPLDRFHVPRRLRRVVRSLRFTVTADHDFAAVIGRCAASAEGREQTWINADIERVFVAMARDGHAHSIETWRDGSLVGGLYGVAIGGAFFGESMFSSETDASKVALVHLVARLRIGGFTLLDTQFITTHLQRFGATEIPRDTYKARLADALSRAASWGASDPAGIASEVERLAGGRVRHDTEAAGEAD